MIRDLMTDAEWGFFEPFVTVCGPRCGRPAKNHRRMLDGIFWISRTGAPWRDLPDFFGPWNSVYRQFRRWTASGLWDLMLETLNGGGDAHASLQMIDSTIIRAHQHSAGAKRGIKKKVLGALAVASRPKSI